MIKGNSKIRHIFRNGKRISRITRGNDVIFRDNLFDGYDSEWCIKWSIAIQTGFWAGTGDSRTTIFFKVKPNTTYRYTSLTAGDRFNIYAIDGTHNIPPVPTPQASPYSDNVRIIEGTLPAQQPPITDYTFTTSSTDRMVYIYCALSTRPTGIYVREV